MDAHQTISLIRTLLNELETQLTSKPVHAPRPVASVPVAAFTTPIQHTDPPSVLAVLKKHKDGIKMDQLKREVDGDPHKAIAALIDAGRVKKRGEKRATTYSLI